MASEGNPSRQQGWRDVLLWVVLAVLLRCFILEPRWIPSGSMLPTLELQDRILVEKIRPKLADQRHQALSIGDVVVFSVPEALIEAGYDPQYSPDQTGGGGPRRQRGSARWPASTQRRKRERALAQRGH